MTALSYLEEILGDKKNTSVSRHRGQKSIGDVTSRRSAREDRLSEEPRRSN